MKAIQKLWRRFALLLRPSHRCPVCRRRFVDVDKHRSRMHKPKAAP